MRLTKSITEIFSPPILLEDAVVVAKERVKSHVENVLLPHTLDSNLAYAEYAEICVPVQATLHLQGTVHGTMRYTASEEGAYQDIWRQVNSGDHVTVKYRPRRLFPDKIVGVSLSPAVRRA